MLPKRTELPILFGQIHNGIWVDQSIHMKKISVPNFLYPRWRFMGKEVRSMFVNKIMEKPLYRAWSNINERKLVDEVQSYDGCFVIRQSRSDGRPSVHSWGLAIDINAETNRLGVIGDMNLNLVKCFTDAGFIWGGSWKSVKDFMHFQYVMED